ncbi:hypothetical protein ACJMK2_042197 [Sinanodonta woodiana]|uniref:Uncharacterized protein n=1 Tax=Sinanodonta woodiana TaxID=1069815 RepID=A0ABD3W9L9_SINWO
MAFFIFFKLLLISTVAELAYSCRPESSCQQIYKNSVARVSGEYQLCTPTRINIDVFCDFYDGYGYTYVSSESLGVLQTLSGLYTNKTNVVVRHRHTNGTQRGVEIAPLSEFTNTYPLSVQLSHADGFKTPLNAAMQPYIYIGFLPESYAKSTTKQGYQVGGVDYTFTNCDSNPNSYLALFTNPSNGPLNDYYTRCCMSDLVSAWITKATVTPLPHYLPKKYFYDFEMHMGGCGGYVSTGSFPTVTGAAVGFKFVA